MRRTAAWPSSGSMLRWLAALIGGGLARRARRRGGGAIAPGADGRADAAVFPRREDPDPRPLARGTITGLSLGHGRGHIWRAALEAVACGFRHHLDVLADHGRAARRLYASDGGSRSDGLDADRRRRLRRPVSTLADAYGSSVGAAWVAAVGLGLAEWGDVAKARRLGETFSPRPDAAQSTIASTPITARSTGRCDLSSIAERRHDLGDRLGHRRHADRQRADASSGAELKCRRATASTICARGPPLHRRGDGGRLDDARAAAIPPASIRQTWLEEIVAAYVAIGAALAPVAGRARGRGGAGAQAACRRPASPTRCARIVEANLAALAFGEPFAVLDRARRRRVAASPIPSLTRSPAAASASRPRPAGGRGQRRRRRFRPRGRTAGRQDRRARLALSGGAGRGAEGVSQAGPTR